jgi:uncharacterized protein YutE (UPF0331/DUF86 family)
MVNRNLLAAKLTELASRLEQVRRHRKATLEELESDRDATELVAFNLMLAIQVCADVANHLIADEGWHREPPGRLSRAFRSMTSSGPSWPRS